MSKNKIFIYYDLQKNYKKKALTFHYRYAFKITAHNLEQKEIFSFKKKNTKYIKIY